MATFVYKAICFLVIALVAAHGADGKVRCWRGPACSLLPWARVTSRICVDADGAGRFRHRLFDTCIAMTCQLAPGSVVLPAGWCSTGQAGPQYSACSWANAPAR
jgi:hypothetical protein